MNDFKWRFAGGNHSTKRGFNDAGIENFTGERIKSLVREICQNSLDARASTEEKHVHIEFKQFKLKKDKFPDLNGISEALSASLEQAELTDNAKAKKFFKNSLSIIKSDYIDFLRISDFNTTGLTGVKSKINSVWMDLVHSEGVSNKRSTDGGSFGIGKNATFACSDLRTVIYSTMNIDSEVATQGVSNLISFPCGDAGDYTQGVGYLAINDKNMPLLDNKSFDDSFQRNNPGTDIYIAGLSSRADFKDQVVLSILENFLYAIYQDTLRATVDDIEVTKDTLSKLITKYQKKGLPVSTIELSKLLFDPSVKTYQESIYEEEIKDIEIRVILNEEGSRKVSMIRKPWMKIKEIANFPRQYKFFGAVIIKGDKLNALLRNVENPQHNDWEPERLQGDDSEERILVIDKIKKLRNAVINKLEVLYKPKYEDYADLFGAGDYIPFEDPKIKPGAQNKLKDVVKRIVIKDEKLKPAGNKTLDFKESEPNVIVDIEGDQEREVDDDPNPKNPHSKTKREVFEKVLKKNGTKVSIQKDDIRIIAVNRNEGVNRIAIYRKSEKIYAIKLFVLDEQAEIIKGALLLEEVVVNDDNINFFENCIEPVKLTEGRNFIDIKINIKEYVSLGVELYEIQR